MSSNSVGVFFYLVLWAIVLLFFDHPLMATKPKAEPDIALVLHQLNLKVEALSRKGCEE